MPAGCRILRHPVEDPDCCCRSADTSRLLRPSSKPIPGSSANVPSGPNSARGSRDSRKLVIRQPSEWEVGSNTPPAHGPHASHGERMRLGVFGRVVCLTAVASGCGDSLGPPDAPCTATWHQVGIFLRARYFDNAPCVRPRREAPPLTPQLRTATTRVITSSASS